MSKKQLDQCRTANDFIRYAEHNGGHIDRCNGGHAIIKGPSGGICPVPTHPGEIHKGTRGSIIRMLLAIGLGVSIFACSILSTLIK